MPVPLQSLTEEALLGGAKRLYPHVSPPEGSAADGEQPRQLLQRLSAVVWGQVQATAGKGAINLEYLQEWLARFLRRG